ncbi:MAG: tetratricopeptide repeat protein [Promethearchaeota archaeon]
MSRITRSEKEQIKQMLKALKYSPEINAENNLRYSIIDDSIIVLTSKLPISIGVKLNVPFEGGAFYNSIIFQPKIINSEILELINFFAVNLEYIRNNINIEHNFPIESRKMELVNLLNKFLPEYFSKDTERQWLTRIRLALLNKHKLFEEFSGKLYDQISDALEHVGLTPTFKLPILLKNGVPRQKVDRVLFFTNAENNEYFIMEPGFITFYRDLMSNHIMIKTHFESYSFLILYSIFKDVGNFSIIDLILSWIRYTRMTLNPMINIIESEYVVPRDLYELNLDTFYHKYDLSETAIPIPQLVREIFNKDELIKLDQKFFNHAPKYFDELTALKQYKEADDLIKAGKLQVAIKALGKILVIFNRYKQKKGVVLTLFKLSDIAKDMRNFDKAIEYLENALDLSKTGEIPSEYIIKTHEKLGDVYFKSKQYEKAMEHYKIIIKFLEALNDEKYIYLITKSRLEIAKLLITMEQFKDANLLFKKIIKDIHYDKDLEIHYYYTRALYLIAKGSYSNAAQLLKKGCTMVEADNRMRALCHLELAKLFFYEKKNTQRSAENLLAADKLLEEKNNEDILLKVQIYEILADVFNKENDREAMKFYLDRVRQLRNVLKIRGVYI